MTQTSEEQQQQQQKTTSAILDEYCRCYSDFSKILNIYIKNFYPQLHFEFEQLLDASYSVWHRLSDEEKISLSTFLEEISQEFNHANSSSSKMETFNGFINSELLSTKLKYPNCSTKKNQKINYKSIPLNTSSNIPSIEETNKLFNKKRQLLTPFHIYLKDERKKFIQKHANMSIRDINKRLSERWQKMSKRMKEKYEYRSYRAKKRLYKIQNKSSIHLKKPSFIKRMSLKSIQINKKNQQLINSSR